MHAWVIAGLLCLSLPMLAQHGSTTAVNPYTGPEHLQAGANLYRAQCAGCHGIDGTGTGAGPNLTSGKFRHGSSDEALFGTISKGVPGTSMPAFSFGGVQIWELVTQVRALGAARGVSSNKGSIDAGKVLFSANCSGCHAVGGTGSSQGPDLSAVGLRLSEVEIRRALLDPDADVASEFWRVAVTTVAGQSYRGPRLNEDTYSLQLRDESGRLVSLAKRDIAKIEFNRRSPMPSFAGRLSETQIADLVAYLVSLKEER